MERKNLLRIFLPAIIALSLVAGMFIGRYYYQGRQDQAYIVYPRADKLSGVVNYISKEYVDPIQKDEFVEKIIPLILDELDPHSQYIPASEFQAVNEPLEGNFSGIGVQFNMLNDTLVVLKAIANGPSEKVGIVAGDRIVMVDSNTVAGVKMPSDSIVKMLKGPKGTVVRVGVDRHAVKDLVFFNITRDNIPLYSIDVAYMMSKDMAYIRINNFSRTTFDEFASAIGKLKAAGMKKLVLDLRGNGGGLLTTAAMVADQFLSEGQLIVYTEGNARKREDFKATSGGLCHGIETAVLIDESSASASEILAGALQDNDRAVVIGRRSFGKGLVQEQNMLNDGSAIRLTIARYYTPTGRSIQKSYKNGSADYYNELSVRYEHGEFMEKDSSQFHDSLKFVTPAGKIVYGGGGIMPDIFVPLDTIGVTDYLIDIRDRGLIYRYALEYTDANRSELLKSQNLTGLLAYLKKNNALGSFISFASKNGVPENKKELGISKEIIETQLYAYIARNVFDNEGFYPVIEKIDKTLQVALEELEKE